MDNVEHPIDGALPAASADLERIVTNFSEAASHIANYGDLEECAALIVQLEAVKASLCAVQMQTAHQYEKNMIRLNEEKGCSGRNTARGTGAALAMMRRTSNENACAYAESSRMLIEDLPYIFGQFLLGEFTEAQILAITAPLREIDQEHRRAFDELCEANPDMFEGQGTRQISDTVRSHVLSVSPQEQAEHLHDLDERRCLSVKVEDGFVRVSGRLPLAQGMAFKKGLECRVKQWRRNHRSDPRTKAQLRADFFATSLLEEPLPSVPLALDIKVVMTDRTLFQGGNEPAFLEGYGYIPAPTARELVAGDAAKLGTSTTGRQLMVFPEIQRLFMAPDSKALIAMESQARLVPEKLREFIVITDQEHCQTPYCNGKVEEIDHIKQHVKGGATEIGNLKGSCKFCNLSKEVVQWYERRHAEQPHAVRVQLPGGAVFQSLAPRPTPWAHRKVPRLLERAWWVVAYESSLTEHCGPQPKAA